MLRGFVLFLTATALSFAQKYDGPRPPKPDIPYLKHASTLVATEVTEAKQEKKKNDTLYTIAGAASPVKTPLSSPIFLLQADKLIPNRIGLYKMDVKGGHRELFDSPKKPLRAIRVDVTHLGQNLYKLEVNESLEPGEYSLSPEGSNQAFCFQVY